MRIALAQINSTVGDLEENVEKIVRNIQRAKAEGADLILFPELAITGYPPKDLLNYPYFLRDNRAALERVVENSTGIKAVVGFIDYDEDKVGNDGRKTRYNAAAFVSDGKLVGIQHKTLLPTYDVFDEKRYFLPATEHHIFELEGIKLGMEICEDLWDENYEIKVTDILARKGADFIVNISASPFQCGKRVVREGLLRDRATRNRVPIFYVNLVGGQDDLVFDGESLVLDKEGHLIAVGKKFQEDFVLVDLDLTTKVGNPIFSEPYPKIQELHNALVLGTRDYLKKSGFGGAVIGLSGGIDSAVTAAIATEALGKEGVIGVSMPSQYSSQHSKDDARKLAKNLGIRFEAVSIEKIFDSFNRDLSGIFRGYGNDVTEENLQARIRGNILMALSNKFGYLVLATGNKSELAVGYCTLYGDMCGGYSVLSDVLKTEVYELARYINRKRQVIPQNSIDKPPSAELRPGQLDQDALPPYNILDGILKAYIEEEKSEEEIVAMGYDGKTVDSVLRKVDGAEFKRRQAAPGIKITEKAFGSGFYL